LRFDFYPLTFQNDFQERVFKGLYNSIPPSYQYFGWFFFGFSDLDLLGLRGQGKLFNYLLTFKLNSNKVKETVPE